MLAHPSALQAVGFCANGERVYGAGIMMPPGADRPGNRPDVLNVPLGRVEFRSWDFSPDARDMAVLRAESQRMASRALSAGEQSNMLTQLEVAERKALLPQPMTAPVHTPEEIAQYHRDEAMRSHASAQWSAAAWHADRLSATRDGDYVLKLRSFFRAGAWTPVLQAYKAALAFRNGSDDTPELRRIIALALSEQAKPGVDGQAWTAMSEAWSEAVKREPEDTFLLLKRAEVCLRADHHDEARRELENAIARESKDESGPRLSAWQ